MARTYLIIPTSELSKVNFSQVCETSADTVRKSIDGTKFIVEGDTINAYTLAEMLVICESEEWTSNEM